MKDYPREIEEQTAALWVARGTIRATYYGSENTYYENEFGTCFYCKNYPRNSDGYPIDQPLEH